jgi:formylglycine-generating enzyme required for sulfatase activity
MVRDDVNSPQKDPQRRTPLARLIAKAPGGLDSRRVVKWARDLANDIDERLDRRACHGMIDADHVVIDADDRAHLEAGHADRDLLLDDAAPVPGDDVRALAATLYEALAGRRPDDDPVPIAGVEVRINMGLLMVLGSQPAVCSYRASDLAAIMEGADDIAPVALAETAPLSSGRSGRRPLSVVAGVLAVAAMAVAAWIWLERRETTPSQRQVAAVLEQTPLARALPAAPSHGVEKELADVDRDIEVAAAEQARRQWEAVAARQPDLLSNRLRAEADRIAESAAWGGLLAEDGRFTEAKSIYEQAGAAMTRLIEQRAGSLRAADAAFDRWRQTLAVGPDQWSTVPAVQLDCADAEALVQDARLKRLAGRFEDAAAILDDATEFQQAAITGHDGRIDELLDQLVRNRDDGRFYEAITVIDELEPHRKPAEIRAARIDTYLAWVRARNRRSSRVEARRAVDALLDLDPDHAEGLALRRTIATYWQARAGDLLVNSLSQTLVLVEPAEFVMGSPRTELFHQRSEQQHTVALSRPFWIGRIEVTRGQFAQFVAATAYLTEAEAAGWSLGLGPSGQWQRTESISWRNPGFEQADNHPVVCVSWNDATAFCEWLSGVEGRRYRLPTEAQWEFACRAGAQGAYGWGNDPYRDNARCNAADESWMDRYPDIVGFTWLDGYVFTSPVASFPTNAWGMFDVHGNVQEWCVDVYAPYSAARATDPVGPSVAVGDRAPRVLRGGSFASLPAACRAAHRDASPPNSSFVTVGFRVVLED